MYPGCALKSAGKVSSCFWAAVSQGKDITKDADCAAQIVELASNLISPHPLKPRKEDQY
jgi:hypothetical protein